MSSLELVRIVELTLGNFLLEDLFGHRIVIAEYYSAHYYDPIFLGDRI